MSVTKAQKQLDQVKALHQAIDNTDLKTVKEIISSSSSPDALQEVCGYELQPYSTALRHSAGVGDTQILACVLDTGIDVNTKQQASSVTQGQTPLHIAALAGKSRAVTMLLSRGANVNTQESEGQTPLHCACSGNDLNTVKLLVEGGAKVNTADHRDERPLQRAILRSSNEICTYLIDNGADLTVKDPQGQTLLHYAVEWENKELIEVFVGKGCSVNAQDNEGCSPLHLAEKEDILDVLVKHGGDVNLRDNCGRPPISKRLDVAKAEFQRINAVLERHLSFETPTTNPEEDVRGKLSDMSVKEEAEGGPTGATA